MTQQHVLIVDGDPQGLKALNERLQKAGFGVSTAQDGNDALAQLQKRIPDLVVSETSMPLLDGFGLCRAMRNDSRYRTIPLVFLTQQKSVEAKVRGLELGGQDYVTKPASFSQVLSRLQAVLDKAEKEKGDRKEFRGGFSGALRDMSVVDLVQTFEMGRKSGVLLLQEQPAGSIYFRDGKVLDAECGRLRGENAFYRLLNCFDGPFEAQFGPCDRSEHIEVSTQGLLMEGLRRIDEWARLQTEAPPLDSVCEVDADTFMDSLADIPDEANGVLRLFDGQKTLAQVIEASDFEDLAALSLIKRLFDDKLIRLTGQSMIRPHDLAATAPVDARPSEYLDFEWEDEEPVLTTLTAIPDDAVLDEAISQQWQPEPEKHAMPLEEAPLHLLAAFRPLHEEGLATTTGTPFVRSTEKASSLELPVGAITGEYIVLALGQKKRRLLPFLLIAMLASAVSILLLT